MIHPSRKETLTHAIVAFAPLGLVAMATLGFMALRLADGKSPYPYPWRDFLEAASVAAAAAHYFLLPTILMVAIARAIARVQPIPIREELALTELRADEVVRGRLLPPLAWIGAATLLVSIHPLSYLFRSSTWESKDSKMLVVVGEWAFLLGPAGLLAGAILLGSSLRRPSAEHANRGLAAGLVFGIVAIWGGVFVGCVDAIYRRDAFTIPGQILMIAPAAWLLSEAWHRLRRAIEEFYRFEPEPTGATEPSRPTRAAPCPSAPSPTPATTKPKERPGVALARFGALVAAWLGATAMGAMVGLTLHILMDTAPFRHLFFATFGFALHSMSGPAAGIQDVIPPVVAGLVMGALQQRILAWRGRKLPRWWLVSGVAFGAAGFWIRVAAISLHSAAVGNRRFMNISGSPVFERLELAAGSIAMTTAFFAAAGWLCAAATNGARKPLLAATFSALLAATSLYLGLLSADYFASPTNEAVRARILALFVYGVFSGIGMAALERFAPRTP